MNAGERPMVQRADEIQHFDMSNSRDTNTNQEQAKCKWPPQTQGVRAERTAAAVQDEFPVKHGEVRSDVLADADVSSIDPRLRIFSSVQQPAMPEINLPTSPRPENQLRPRAFYQAADDAVAEQAEHINANARAGKLGESVIAETGRGFVPVPRGALPQSTLEKDGALDSEYTLSSIQGGQGEKRKAVGEDVEDDYSVPTKRRRKMKSVSTILKTTTRPDATQSQPTTASQQLTQGTAVSQPATKRTTKGATRTTGWNADLDSTGAVGPEARLHGEMSLVEVATYLPHHTQSPHMIMRFIAHGWTSQQIARAQLYPRGLTSKAHETRRNNAIRWQVKVGGAQLFKVQDFKIAKYRDQIMDQNRTGAAGTYDVSGYSTREKYASKRYDAKLTELARGVLIHPSGADAGVLTQAIQYVLANKGTYPTLENLTTADVSNMARKYGFVRPVEAETRDWDVNGRDRILQAIERAGAFQ